MYKSIPYCKDRSGHWKDINESTSAISSHLACYLSRSICITLSFQHSYLHTKPRFQIVLGKWGGEVWQSPKALYTSGRQQYTKAQPPGPRPRHKPPTCSRQAARMVHYHSLHKPPKYNRSCSLCWWYQPPLIQCIQAYIHILSSIIWLFLAHNHQSSIIQCRVKLSPLHLASMVVLYNHQQPLSWHCRVSIPNPCNSINNHRSYIAGLVHLTLAKTTLHLVSGVNFFYSELFQYKTLWKWV